MHDSNKFILHMMELGVHAFLLKNTEPDELEKAIYAVADKDFYHNDLVARGVAKKCEGKKAGSATDVSTRRIDRTRKRNPVAHLPGTHHERNRTTVVPE